MAHVVNGGLPSKRIRLWDKDFELIHVFAEGESHTEFSLKHPVARRLWKSSEDGHVDERLTIDDGTDCTYARVKELLVTKPQPIVHGESAGDPVMTVVWSDES